MGEEEQFRVNVEQMTQYMQEVPAALDAFEQNVENAAKWFPMLVGMVRDLLAQLRAAIEQFLEEVAHVIQSHTPFVSLIVRAFDWLHQVQKPVSHLAGTVKTTQGNENLVFWTGEGRTVYDGKRGEQAAALTAVSERAQAVHDWLMGIVRANIAYTGKVVDQLVDLATEIVPIIAKAANPATAASAVGDLKNLVVTVVQHRVEEYRDMFDRLGAAAERSGVLVKNMSDHDTFPGGAWPQAVA